jgi:hypothetical protein
MFGVAVTVIPVVLGVVFTRSDPATVRMPVLVVCAAGYGLALAWTGGRLAARAAGSGCPSFTRSPSVPSFGRSGR